MIMWYYYSSDSFYFLNGSKRFQLLLHKIKITRKGIRYTLPFCARELWLWVYWDVGGSAAVAATAINTRWRRLLNSKHHYRAAHPSYVRTQYDHYLNVRMCTIQVCICVYMYTWHYTDLLNSLCSYHINWILPCCSSECLGIFPNYYAILIYLHLTHLTLNSKIRYTILKLPTFNWLK